jgi:hypothetical protein
MKVLIISASRTGGTRLGEWISKELDLDFISEPLSHWRNPKLTDVWDRDNCCVKINPEEYDDVTVQNRFNKVILLVRDNIHEQSISLLRANETNKWHEKYTVDPKWLEERKDKLNECIETCENDKIQTLKWKTDTNILVTYEKVYFEINTDRKLLKNYLNIVDSKYEHLIDKENKYRYTKKNVI